VGDEGKSPLMEVSRYHVDISYLASMNETVKPYFNSIAGLAEKLDILADRAIDLAEIIKLLADILEI